MADLTLTLASERWLDEVLLYGTVADGAGADWSDRLALPAGLGDVALMEMLIRVEAIATATSLAGTGLAASAHVISADLGSVVDIIGNAPWYRMQALRATAYLSPDPLVLVRQNERIGVQSSELDSNGAPTGDVYYYVKVVRVRPLEATAGPIHLVR